MAGTQGEVAVLRLKEAAPLKVGLLAHGLFGEGGLVSPGRRPFTMWA